MGGHSQRQVSGFNTFGDPHAGTHWPETGQVVMPAAQVQMPVNGLQWPLQHSASCRHFLSFFLHRPPLPNTGRVDLDPGPTSSSGEQDIPTAVSAAAAAAPAQRLNASRREPDSAMALARASNRLSIVSLPRRIHRPDARRSTLLVQGGACLAAAPLPFTARVEASSEKSDTTNAERVHASASEYVGDPFGDREGTHIGLAGWRARKARDP